MQKPIVLKGDLSEELKNEFAAQAAIAVDCEMMGLNPVRDRLCVVQVAAENSACVLVQIDEQQGAPRLKAVLEQESVTKIFHFARMDILFLFARLRIDVRNIYCTKVASRLARTYTERHGLPELVREFAGDNMDKTYQSSDWGAPDLKAEQIRYAASDVIYLFKIRKRLEIMLKRENRQELFEKVIAFLPVQRELDCLGYQAIFEHKHPS